MADEKGMKGWGPHVEAKAEPKAEVKKPEPPKKEEAKEKPKKVNPIEHLEAIVAGLEKRDAPFSSEERVELQGLQKRLSRTLGDYRDPNPE